MKIQNLFLSLAIASLSFTSALAQTTTEEETPFYYIGLKGGVQGVPTNYDFTKLLTPSVGVMAGMQFNRLVGARLDVQGLWSRTAFRSADETMNFRYYTADADLVFNITNLFIPYHHVVDWSLVFGAGFNYSWDAADAANYPMEDRGGFQAHESLKSHNVRLGTIFGFNCSKNWAIELEFDANNLKDRFNSKCNDHTDWQLTGMLGLAYRFGHPRSSHAPERTAAQPVERCATCGLSLDQCIYGGNHPARNDDQLPAVVYNKAEEILIDIFFDLDNAEIRPSEDAKLRGLSDFIRTHEFGTVSVKAYADRETGNPTYNQALSERRANTIVQKLTQVYGIPYNRIESRAYGDKVQPFAENDLNRVVIINIKEAQKKE